MQQFKEKNYTFDDIWFKNTNTCNEIYQLKEPKILEIGSYCGASTCYWIENLKPTLVMCIDTWMGSFEHTKKNFTLVEDHFDNNIIIAKKYAPNCIIEKIKGSSFEVVPVLQSKYSNYFDFIYVDGSHISPHVLIDAINCFKLLKINGIMAFDDYEWGDKKSLNAPKRAIDVFIDIFSPFVKIIKKEYQLWLIKIKDPYTTYFI